MPLDRTDAGPITGSRIRSVLISKTGADPRLFEGTTDASLEELGIDSLAVLELTAVVEDEYGMKLPNEALAMTVNEIVTQTNLHAQRV